MGDNHLVHAYELGLVERSGQSAFRIPHTSSKPHLVHELGQVRGQVRVHSTYLAPPLNPIGS